MDYHLKGPDGRTFDARVSIEAGNIILHSWSGKPRNSPASDRGRNPDYTQAFNVILDRLNLPSNIVERVLLISKPVLNDPEIDRTLAIKADFERLPLQQVKNQIRQRMRAYGRSATMPANEGNQSKKILIETGSMGGELTRRLRVVPIGSTELADAPSGSPAPPLPAAELNKAQPGHILSALEVVASLGPTDEERTWIEGNPTIAVHLKRERQPGLAAKKRAQFIYDYGRLTCESCGLDPAAVYGEDIGSACIEIHHHRTHVADMEPGHMTSLDDLQCLCANCHRVLHRALTLGLHPSLINGQGG